MCQNSPVTAWSRMLQVTLTVSDVTPVAFCNMCNICSGWWHHVIIAWVGAVLCLLWIFRHKRKLSLKVRERVRARGWGGGGGLSLSWAAVMIFSVVTGLPSWCHHPETQTEHAAPGGSLCAITVMKTAAEGGRSTFGFSLWPFEATKRINAGNPRLFMMKCWRRESREGRRKREREREQEVLVSSCITHTAPPSVMAACLMGTL